MIEAPATEVPVESVVRWVGSKRHLAATLADDLVVRSGCRYYEPFAGSAALFFALAPESAVLGDFNEELINAYRQLRDQPEELVELIWSHPVSEEWYYRMRAMKIDEMDDLTRAARFFYLNRFCFNGVYRTNLKGQFNVPMGKKTGRLPSEDQWLGVSALLQKADLRAGDFRSTLDDAGEGDLVYLDPPYSQVASRYRGEFGYGAFSDEDIDVLLDEMERLNAKCCKVIVSFKHDERFSALSDAWRSNDVAVRTRVAGKSSARRQRSEMLIMNSLVEESQS